LDENAFAPPPNDQLHIKKPIFDTILCLPKNTIRKAVFSHNARAAQNYNIVEDLAQAPCAMSTLEILQNCLAQRRILLEALSAIEPQTSNHLMFSLEHFKTRLSHQLAFQIHTSICGKTIHRTVLDEGASTSIMSLSCWRAIGSLEVQQYPTMLQAFDGQVFQPYGLSPSLAITLGGKTVSIHVEIVDATLYYNILLGQNWFYAMTAVASSVFRMVQFPH